MRARLAAVLVLAVAVGLPATALAAPVKKPVTASAFQAELSPGRERLTLPASIDAFNTIGTRVPAGDSLTGWTISYGDRTKPARGRVLPHFLTHAYKKAGTYRVVLTVTDARHQQSSAVLRFRATGGYSHPTAAIRVTRGYAPVVDSDLVGFDVANYAWGKVRYTSSVDFGDGTAPATPTRGAHGSVGHTYSKPGTYLARLTVRDARGGVGVATLPVTVGHSPYVTTQITGAVEAGQPFTLTVVPHQGDGVTIKQIGVIAYGATVVPVSPDVYTVTYPASSSYRFGATLTVTYNDSHNRRHLDQLLVQVQPAPTVSLIALPGTGEVDFVATTVLGTHTVTSWSLVDSVDGVIDSGAGAFQSDDFSAPAGTYTTTLNLVLDDGRTISSTATYTVS